ncbi:MAG: chemotaxis protein CheB [Caldilineaceae bacterium]
MSTSAPHETPPEDEPAPGSESPHAPQVQSSSGLENNASLVVGIGASAGGLDAFKDLFTNLPSDTGMAFVIVQHLDPTHESILAELIGKFTHMPVLQVEDQLALQPNRVYVIPPNADLTLQNSVLNLTKPAKRRGLRLPIDHFLRSLATDQRDKAACIILSGTGTDGTLGLKAVKEEGGLTIVQSPDSARYNGMPLSAINTGLVDMVLKPDSIGDYLVAYAERLRIGDGQQIQQIEPDIADTLHDIYALLKLHTGHDFSGYKENTIIRRLERRMTINQISDATGYLRYLQETPLEVEALFRELLIGVTSFFRDPQAFEFLEREVIRPLFASTRDTPRQIRVWTPGCATGEEAYSIAILLQEHLDRTQRPVEFQVFATDIDQAAILKAREGRYPESIAADVTAERLSRYFVRDEKGDSFQIKKQIRDRVVFAEQSVIKDPPFSRLDLIVCRNLMIYLQADLQQRLLSMFHYALNPGGCLFLKCGDIGQRRKAVSHRRPKVEDIQASQVRCRHQNCPRILG